MERPLSAFEYLLDKYPQTLLLARFMESLDVGNSMKILTKNMERKELLILQFQSQPLQEWLLALPNRRITDCCSS